MIDPILSLTVCLTAALLAAASSAFAADPIAAHPNGEQLKRAFSAPAPADFKPTGLTRADYLKLIAGNVDFFKSCQNAEGAIIDPVSHGERQYSTPAFAAAAGILVQQAGRTDLREPASRAFSRALEELVTKHAADQHADFFIPLLMHAYRFLQDGTPPDQLAKWKQQLADIRPDTMYRADLRHMNWNIVSDSGELLRRHDGLVAPDQMDAQMRYLETCLEGHVPTFTKLGLFEDPGAPMAYDAFSRLWLEDVFADKAYDGKLESRIGDFLRTGGLSTLLMISPTGEWPTGGRSSLHNWNEAEVAVICEINANYWKGQGRDDVAGAFKRAAHMLVQSIQRWQRPSGELWIIKNRAEPQTRFAYEGYSNHSQYNLLPMAMLAIATARSDEAIAERPMPSEIGGYVFDARETFHKVFAAAGGYYVEIDTQGDPHYNATGLQRVHRVGVPYSSLSDSAAPARVYQPEKTAKIGLSLGLCWKDTKGDWQSLSSFTGPEEKKPTAQQAIGCDLKITHDDPANTAFTVIYTLDSKTGGKQSVTEQYTLSSGGVQQVSSIDGNPAAIGVHLPVQLTDGAKPTTTDIAHNQIRVMQRGCETLVTVPADQVRGEFALKGATTLNHCGEVREAVAQVGEPTVTVRVELNKR